MRDGNMEADRRVLVYTWCPPVDYVWIGTPFDGHPEIRTPPRGRVFAVLVCHETENEYNVVGSIEKWNWIREDERFPHAPIDWENRYERRLWSRGI